MTLWLNHVCGTVRLNLACGTNVFADWVNVDRTDVNEEYLRHLRGLDISLMSGWPPEQIELSKAITAGRVPFMRWDLRKGLPMWASGTVGAILIGQAFEHFHPRTECPRLLAECYRVLAPGGVLRIVTPDIVKIVGLYTAGRLGEVAPEQPAFYANASPEAQLSYLLFGASGEQCTRENYDGHFHVWKDRDLAYALSQAGFRGDKIWRRDMASEAFAGTHDFGMSHSMGMEASK